MKSKCTPKIKHEIYDITKSYLENAEEGPFFSDSIPERIYPPKNQWHDFLGHRIASRIGIPAGPLLNSKWIRFASDFGYDILCYKTIRNGTHAGHPPPNVVYIEGQEQLPSGAGNAFQSFSRPEGMNHLAITNSFGMPSRSKEYLMEDIPKAQATLRSGQVMIVSIVGTPPEDGSVQSLIQDYIETALIAKECGAQIIEVNYSCPNVAGKEGSIYLDPAMITLLTKAIVSVIGEIPLIIKVGCYPNRNLLQKALYAATSAGARGISGINTISKTILNTKGKPALGKNRLTGGVCGAPIRHAALNFIRDCREIIDAQKYDLTLIGCGGITLSEHFTDFFNAGVDVAMTATGMMWDPHLAMRYHEVNG